MSNMNYKTYVLITSLYGILGLFGIAGILYFFIQRQIFLAVISFLILLVSLDNFFCGARITQAGIEATQHYAVPPFLKFKKK